MNKRQFLKSIGLLGITTTILGYKNGYAEEESIPFTGNNQYLQEDKFTLSPLPYAYDALEDVIDKQTMEIHHGKHHKAYVDNLNKFIHNHKKEWNSLEDILQQLTKKTEPLVRNNAGGHWNHLFFWESMSPKKNQQPGPKFTAAMQKRFTNFDTFKTMFTSAATGQFGSGWAWVCKNKFGDLFITSTPNQDNPLMKKLVDKAGTPILGIDVWEHAYYLKYQNKRADYVKRFFEIINWEKVEERM